MPRPVPQHKNNLTRDEFPAGIGYRPAAPRVLCFGDSWMQYSPHPTDLNKQLARVFRRSLFLREGLGGRDRETWHAALPRIGRLQIDSARRFIRQFARAVYSQFRAHGAVRQSSAADFQRNAIEILSSKRANTGSHLSGA